MKDVLVITLVFVAGLSIAHWYTGRVDEGRCDGRIIQAINTDPATSDDVWAQILGTAP